MSLRIINYRSTVGPQASKMQATHQMNLLMRQKMHLYRPISFLIVFHFYYYIYIYKYQKEQS